MTAQESKQHLSSQSTLAQCASTQHTHSDMQTVKLFEGLFIYLKG